MVERPEMTVYLQVPPHPILSPLFEHARREEQGYVWWILPRALGRAQDRRVDFGYILLDPVILSDLD